MSDGSSDVCSSDLRSEAFQCATRASGVAGLRRRCAQRPQPIGNHIEGNLMADTLTADDPRYRAMFDVANEAASHGDGHVHGDLTPLMSQLRERAPVLKGSLRELQIGRAPV